MAVHLVIDDLLLKRALAIGAHRTKKAVVTEALEEYIRRHEQTRITRFFGKIDFDPAYDYKEQRSR